MEKLKRYINIVDAGSTKTRIVRLDRDTGQVCGEVTIQGLNPLQMTEEQLRRSFYSSGNSLDYTDSDVAYFGAGCIPGAPTERMERVLKYGCGNHVSVSSDMQGTILSLFGSFGSGIASILGTGSNSALVRKGEIVAKIAPLGYLLGDEGSGASIGKRFLRELLRGNISSDTAKAFYAETNNTSDTIMGSVYHSNVRSLPLNRYFAQFTRFIAGHMDDPCCEAVVKDEFRVFLKIISVGIRIIVVSLWDLQAL